MPREVAAGPAVLLPSYAPVVDRAEPLRQVANFAAGLEDDDLRTVLGFLTGEYKARERRAD